VAKTTASVGKTASSWNDQNEARLSVCPPIRIHVGDDEVLLDDSRRYVERAVSAGVDAKLDVWMGMPHGSLASIGKLKATAQALDAVGAFLTERLQAHASL
jgi:monoterpene epsilon-lactone hydrolase